MAPLPLSWLLCSLHGHCCGWSCHFLAPLWRILPLLDVYWAIPADQKRFLFSHLLAIGFVLFLHPLFLVPPYFIVPLLPTMSLPPLPRLADGVRRMSRATWVTRDGITQIFNRWRPPRPPRFNNSDSISDPGGSFESDVDEDEVDFSLGVETLGFDWVEWDDDERNYALFVNREFFQSAVVMETTLNHRLATVENAILAALIGQRLPVPHVVTETITKAFAESRVEVARLFYTHRNLFK